LIRLVINLVRTNDVMDRVYMFCPYLTSCIETDSQKASLRRTLSVTERMTSSLNSSSASSVSCGRFNGAGFL
jgi:hypothetical protein